MKYISTNNKSPSIPYEEAIFAGLAPDGGLYVPESIPQFSHDELQSLVKMSLHDIATLVLNKWFHDELSKEELRDIVTNALSFPIPFVEVGNHRVLELFHGPTLSFKDFTARIVTPLMAKCLKSKGKKLRLLLSSAGDTGSAVAHSCSNLDNSEVVVVIPKYGESVMKREQIVRVGGNVTVVEVDGNFDTCRDFVSKSFSDPSLHKVGLIPANSISIIHLIPQIIYFVYVYSLLYPKLATVLITSTDFANAYVALMAKYMGIPFEQIVLTCDSDHPAYKYFTSGEYTEVKYDKKSKGSRNPGNFERVLSICNHSHVKFCHDINIIEICESKVPVMINALYHEHGYITDFNTARSWLAGDTIDSNTKNIVIIGKVSPLKYADEIQKKTGIKVDNHAILAELLKHKSSKVIPMTNKYEDFRNFLDKKFS